MFRAPTRPKTPTKNGVKNMLVAVVRLYAERMMVKMPMANIAKDNSLPIDSATLKTSRASVPVVSLKTGSRLGM